MNYTHDELWKAYIKLGKKALSYSHYDLAEQTAIPDVIAWKDFLMTPKVSDYIRAEMELIRNAAINEMVQDAAKSRSVGQSQLINALQKIDETTSQKTGPTFIYCHVPLSEPQKSAPNVRECTTKGVIIDDEGGYIIDES
jgi:hypothetical protein